MPQRAKPIAVAALAIGALLFTLGLYGRLGASFGLFSAVGAVLVLAGAGTLVVAQRPLAFKRPHGGVGAAVGGALALAVDVLVHVEVFIAPQGSTAGLLLIFVPFWNNLVIVPAGTTVTWLLVRRRSEGLEDH